MVDFESYLRPCYQDDVDPYEDQGPFYSFHASESVDCGLNELGEHVKVLSLEDILSGSRQDPEEDRTEDGEENGALDSSLKPRRRRRSVKFADEAGLRLTSCFYFVQDSDHALSDNSHNWDDFIESLRVQECLTGTLSSATCPDESPPPDGDALTLVAVFEQPFANFQNFVRTFEENNVALENVICENCHLFGTIRVKPLGGAVDCGAKVRFTWDGWESFMDMFAIEAPTDWPGCNFKTFTFSFSVSLESLSQGKKLQLAVCFTVQGQDFWDNNDGENYVFLVEKESNENDVIAECALR